MMFPLFTQRKVHTGTCLLFFLFFFNMPSLVIFSVYGLYVIDECNIETHGMKPYVGRLADDPTWADAHLQRIQRLYYRDRAHTCVIGWSLGNEAGYGAVHDAMAAWLRERDPSRIVMYEPASYGLRGQVDLTSVTGPERTHTGALKLPKPTVPVLSETETVKETSDGASWANVFSLLAVGVSVTEDINTQEKTPDSAAKNTASADLLPATDVVCPMYARVEECVQLSKLFPTMPVIQCEYAHMMGKSNLNLPSVTDRFKIYLCFYLSGYF